MGYPREKDYYKSSLFQDQVNEMTTKQIEKAKERIKKFGFTIKGKKVVKL